MSGKLFLILGASVFLALSHQMAEAKGFDGPFPAVCKNPPEKLQEILDHAAANLSKTDSLMDLTHKSFPGGMNSKIYEKQRTADFGIPLFLEKCSGEIPTKTKRCFENAANFLKLRDAFVKGELFKELPEYLAKQNPAMAQLPSFFFKENRIFTGWDEKIRACQAGTDKDPVCAKVKEWKIVDYQAQSLFWQVMPVKALFIPGEDYDQMFIVTGSGSDHESQDVIVVQKTDFTNGQALEEKVAMMFHGPGRNGPIEPKGASRDGVHSCMTCHNNGPREIFPSFGSVDPKDKPAVEFVNKTFRDYGRVGFKPFFDVRHAGPPMGASMKCTSCHNHGTDESNIKFPSRAPLTWMFNQEFVYSKMSAHGFFAMPPQLGQFQPEVKKYLDTLAKIEQLGEADRKKATEAALLRKGCNFQSPNPDHEHGVSFGEKFGNYSCGNMLESQKQLFALLRDRGLISPADFNEVVATSVKFDKDMRQRYIEMVKDYQEDLKHWLRGNSEACLTAADPIGDSKDTIQQGPAK